MMLARLRIVSAALALGVLSGCDQQPQANANERYYSMQAEELSSKGQFYQQQYAQHSAGCKDRQNVLRRFDCTQAKKVLICSFQFDAKLTLDGVMTLAAGIIAFGAVMWQIRASRDELQRQLDADATARRDEQARERRAVARAILFEIDDLYRYYIRDVREFLDTPDSEYERLMVRTVSPRFTMYTANSARLAELDEETVAAIVHFYGMMDVIFSTLHDYKTALDRTDQLLPGAQREALGAVARVLFQQLKESIPPLVGIVYLLCQKLCKACNVPFEAPRIAVANEPAPQD